MKTVEQWLDEYGESHQNPLNKIIHWLCVPLIMLSLIGLLWNIPENSNINLGSLFILFKNVPVNVDRHGCSWDFISIWC